MSNLTISTEPARIFVTDYASYNQGTQFEFGHWVELSDYTDADELQEYIQNHFTEADKKSPLKCGGIREELMITDFEGFHRDLYCESMSLEDLQNIYTYLENTEDQEQHIIDAFLNLFSFDELNNINDWFYTDLSDSHNINYDFRYEMYEQGCIEIPDNLISYFDFESYGRDCLYDFSEDSGVIFRNH